MTEKGKKKNLKCILRQALRQAQGDTQDDGKKGKLKRKKAKGILWQAQNDGKRAKGNGISLCCHPVSSEGSGISPLSR